MVEMDSMKASPVKKVSWNRKWDEKRLDALQENKSEQEKLNKLTNAKVDAILKLLQDAETQNAKTLTQIQTASVFPNSSIRTSNHTVGQESCSLAETVLAKFRSKIEDLRKQLQSKEEIIENLKKETEIQSQKQKREIEESIQIERSRFEEHQRIHDLDLEKRLKFIDTLLQDKEKWVKQCEKLTTDLKSQQDVHEDQLKALKERMAVELRKQKAEWSQKESEKREKWMKEQKEEILHTTAKAMEPRFIDMSENYKREIRRLREKLEAQEKALVQQEEHTIQLRQRLLQEREDCLEKEKLRSHAQLINEREKLRMQMEAETEQLKAHWREEKENVVKQLQDERLKAESKMHQMQDTHSRALQKMEDQFQNEKAQIFSDHEAQLERVRKNCEMEKECWKKETIEELQEKMLTDLNKVKASLERERDEEIEVVIGRFEAEKEELESELRKRLVQLQHDKEEQTNLVLSKEKQITKLSTELSRLHEHLEEQIAKDQDALEEKNLEIEAAKGHATELREKIEVMTEEYETSNQRHHIKFEALKTDFNQKLKEQENLKASALQDTALMQKEKEDLKQHYESELDTLQNQVQEALTCKDAFIESLQHRLNSKLDEHEAMKKLLLDQTDTLEKN